MAKPANDRPVAETFAFGRAPGMALGEWIRATRTGQGVSQRGLADRSGLSRSYLCDIERGRGSRPSVETLDKLASALGASRTDLLRVAGILESTGRMSDERERRFLAVYRDLGPQAQDAVDRFARFMHAEEHRWVQARLIDGDEASLVSALPDLTSPGLFDGLVDLAGS